MLDLEAALSSQSLEQTVSQAHLPSGYLCLDGELMASLCLGDTKAAAPAQSGLGHSRCAVLSESLHPLSTYSHEGQKTAALVGLSLAHGRAPLLQGVLIFAVMPKLRTRRTEDRR